MVRNLNQLPTPQRHALLAWMSARTPQDENQSTDSGSNASPEKSLEPPNSENINLLIALMACFSENSNPTNFNVIQKWLNIDGSQLTSPKTDDTNSDNSKNIQDADDIAFLCLLEILLNDLVEQSKSESESESKSEKKISSQLTNQDKTSVWKKIRFYVLATLMGIFTSTEAFGSGLLIASVATNKFAIQLLIATAITFIAIGLVASIEIKNMAEEMNVSYLEAKKKYKSMLLKHELNIKIGVHLEALSKSNTKPNTNTILDSIFYESLKNKLKDIETKNQEKAINFLDSFKKHKLRRQIIKNVISFLAASLNAAITYMTAISSIHSAAGFAFSAAALSTPIGIGIASIIVSVWIATYLYSWYCFERKVMNSSLSGLLSAEKDCKVEIRAIAGNYKKPKDPVPRSRASFYAGSLKDKTELAELKSNQIKLS